MNSNTNLPGAKIDGEKSSLNKRLDFLLQGVEIEKAKAFRADYLSKMDELDGRFDSYRR
jgi:hypothetical protein